MIMMDNNGKIRVLGFAGSLRKDSFNKALINTAKAYAPEGIEVEVIDLKGIPLYDQDEERNMPQSVVAFKSKIKEADAILIATPEYNRSIPGVLKNAIDWASRPYGQNSFDDKPIATIGATGGQLIGTFAAQAHLRQIFSFLNAHPLERPQLYIAGASEKIENGLVVDEPTRDLIVDMLKSLAAWARRLKAAQPS